MSITIHDVARRARVSVTTVSRALTEPRLVKKSTLARVLAAAKQLAYRPNPAAGASSPGRPGIWGLSSRSRESVLYERLRGVEARAHRTGYAVLLADSGEDPAAEEFRPHDDESGRRRDHLLALCRRRPAFQQAEATSLVLINRALPGISAALMDLARGMRQGRRSSGRPGSSPLRLPWRPAQCVVEPRAASRPSRGGQARTTSR